MGGPLTDPLSTMTPAQASAVRKAARRVAEALDAIPHGLNGRIPLADAHVLLEAARALRALAATDGLCGSDKNLAIWHADEVERGATFAVPQWASHWRGLLLLLEDDP